jgi:mRNA-degrading endonuclease toxin of MazEF toxin-antitoxin module
MKWRARLGRAHEPPRDVVMVSIPYYDRPGSKDRPGIIVQCDRNNRRLLSTIVAGVTTNLKRVAAEPTQFLIDPSTPDGRTTGLPQASAVKCENLFTVSQADIRRTVGHLSDVLKQKLNDCLGAALELP